MNTILSIDLDILLSPYVGIYNFFIFENKSYDFSWEVLQNSFDINDFKINEEYLNIIKKIILKYINTVDKIYIGYDHSDILNAIEKEKNNFSTPYKFNIYNIDYHHDIGYREGQVMEIREEKICDCGCWVSYLNDNNYLNNYTWIKGIGSSFDKRLLDGAFNDIKPKHFYKYKLEDYVEQLLYLDIDMLYISLSAPWLPPNCYNYIVNFLKSIIPNEKIIYNNLPFFVNGNRKNFLFNKGELITNEDNFNNNQ